MAPPACDLVACLHAQDLAWIGQASMQKDFRQRVLGLKSWNKFCTSHGLYHSKVSLLHRLTVCVCVCVREREIWHCTAGYNCIARVS